MPAESALAARLVKASGPVYVERNGTRLTLAEGDPIRPTDTLLTDGQSTAEVRFEDGSTATLSPNSKLLVSEFVFGGGEEPSFVLNLAQGAMRSVSGGVVKQNPEAFKIVTPKATVGIRGTELFNSVQENQEVHAVLLIGKGHVVVVTGNDGTSIVLNSALQGVTLDGQNVMLKQVYTLPELEAVIRELAPTQLQQPLPTGVEEGNEQVAEQAAQATAPLTVIIIYENPEITTTPAGVGEGLPDGTLISAVNELLGTLADEGFAVSTMDTLEVDNLLTSIELPKTPAATVVGGAAGPDLGQGMGQGMGPALPSQPNQPGEPTPPDPTPPPTPPTPPDPTPPPAGHFVFAGNLPAGWGLEHLAALDPNLALNLSVGGDVGENVPLNTLGMLNGSTAGDVVAINGALLNAQLMGDMETVGEITRARMAGVADIQTGNDTLGVGRVDDASAVYGDAKEITGTASVQFGSDSITIGTLEGQVYGDVKSLNGTGEIVFGDDTINVSTMVAGSSLFGDAQGAFASIAGGNDVINVTLMQGGSVDGGVGSDVITIATMQGGQVVDGGGSDTVNITAMTGGSAELNTGSITVGTLNGAGAQITGPSLNVGSLVAGTATLNQQGTVTVNLMQGGAVNGSAAGDLFTVTANMIDGTVSGGGGNDTFTVNGNMTGGILQGGAGNDAFTITAMGMGGGLVDGGDGDDVITVGNMSGGTLDGGAGADNLTVTGNFSGGTIKVGTSDQASIGTLTGTGSVELSAEGAYLFIRKGMSGGTITIADTSNTLYGGSVSMGDSNTAVGFSNGIINGGSGNDRIELFGSLSGGATLNLGQGDNMVTLNGNMTGGSIFAGTGEDNVTITGEMSAGSINLGGSTGVYDNVRIGHLSGTASLSGDDLNVTVTTMSGGSITLSGDNRYSGAYVDTMTDGTITGSDSRGDGISVTSMQGGTVNGGDGVDNIMITTMSGGKVNGGADDDTISISGNMLGGTVNGGDGRDNITVGGNMSDGLLDGGDGRNTITVNGTMSKGKLSGGAGQDSIVVTTINGEVFIDCGLDNNEIDKFEVTNFLGGKIHLSNVDRYTDQLFLGSGTSFGTYSQTGSGPGGTFTITYTDGRIVTITGAVVGNDAAATWTNLIGRLDEQGTLVAEPVAIKAEEFANKEYLLGDNLAVLVTDTITSGTFAMNGTATFEGNEAAGRSFVTINGDVGGDSAQAFVLSGDVKEARDGVPEASQFPTFGDDIIRINGIMNTNSFIYGDATGVSMSGATNVKLGNDSIYVNTMAGGVIYGDAEVMMGTMNRGNDTIVIEHLNTAANNTASIFGGHGADSIMINDLQAGNLAINLGSDTVADSLTLAAKTSGSPVTVTVAEFNREDTLNLNMAADQRVTATSANGSLVLTYEGDYSVALSGNYTIGNSAAETFKALVDSNHLQNAGTLA